VLRDHRHTYASDLGLATTLTIVELQCCRKSLSPSAATYSTSISVRTASSTPGIAGNHVSVRRNSAITTAPSITVIGTGICSNIADIWVFLFIEIQGTTFRLEVL
jgi:hypothetical protein